MDRQGFATLLHDFQRLLGGFKEFEGTVFEDSILLAVCHGSRAFVAAVAAHEQAADDFTTEMPSSSAPLFAATSAQGGGDV